MKKTTKSRTKFHKGERLFIFVLAVLALLSPVVIVYTSASLTSSNIEVERLQRKITEQENYNSSLSMQVDELASLGNIQNVAKEYGLSYNNDNIVVIK
jgi:cell division protein FtsL